MVNAEIKIGKCMKYKLFLILTFWVITCSLSFAQEKPCLLDTKNSPALRGANAWRHLCLTYQLPFWRKLQEACTLKTFAGLRGSKVIRRTDLNQFIDNLK
jgi:hypothetical protein